MPIPFLRWTGSKRWLTKDHLPKILPATFNNYHEPFLGGGSTFFHIQSNNLNERSFYLSDSNEELINCYQQIKAHPEMLVSCLRELPNQKEEYYKIRSIVPTNDVLRAARFIYLNRTSFNGIYRVNNLGLYNVPYGNRPRVDVTTERLFFDVSSSLSNVVITHCNFDETINNVNEGDLVFLDPPYTVAHENNGFIEYNQNLFSWEDQIRLRDYIEMVITKKAYFILTNASHPSIKVLYKDIGDFLTVSRKSKVGGRNKTRNLFNELIYCNTI